jgi:hypothetical protein
MQKELGFAPLLLVIPVLLLVVAGTAAGAYYYAQNGELPISFSNSQRTNESESSPLPSPVSASPITTPVALATPSPTPVPTPTPSPSPEMQIVVEQDPLKPNCGIMFQTSFDIRLEQGDDSLDISRKAISQYLSQVKLSTAKDTILSSEEKAVAEDYLKMKIFLSNSKVGEVVRVACEDVENACLTAQKAM